MTTWFSSTEICRHYLRPGNTTIPDADFRLVSQQGCEHQKRTLQVLAPISHLEHMIPKILHYVWIGGGEKRSLHEKCIESWHRNLKDWQIIEWNDSNFDVEKARHESRYFRTAYDNRIYEFIADYARLVVLKEHGGVYVDTDIEITRDFTPLLSDNFFIAMQYPDPGHPWVLEGAVMGAPPNHPFIKEVLEYYDDGYWGFDAVVKEIVSQPMVLTHIMKRHIDPISPCVSSDEHIQIFPQGYFHLEKNMSSGKVDADSIFVPETAYAINHAFTKTPSETKAGTSWTINNKAKIFRNKVWYYRIVQPFIKIRKRVARKHRTK